MINTLPHEIILQICSYLVFYDKLNLSMTCRGVRACITNVVLYEELNIPKQHAEHMLNCFQTHLINPSQVKVLHVSFLEEEENRFFSLPLIFPNIRKLYTGPCPTSSKKLKPKEADKIKDIRNTLTAYNTRTCHKAILLLVNKYHFTHITELYLENSFFRINSKFKLDVIQCISHCPSLTVLTLEHFVIDLAFFENMHLNTTTMRELNLIDLRLKIYETELPANISPYQTLETLKITCKVFIDQSHLFVDYLIDKYPNLKTLDINDWMSQARSNAPAYHTVLTYRTYYPILADRMLPLVARLRVLKIEPRLFENFFDTVGPSLSHLTGLGIYNSNKMFTMFKDLKELNFVKSLDVLTSLTVEAKYSMFLYSKKVTIPNIRHLDIFGEYALASRNIELDNLLFTYNGLETLNMSCKGAKIMIGDVNNNTQRQNILKLSIEAKEIAPNVNTYLTDCLPNLKEIYWKCLNYPSTYTFNLPSHTIHSLNICTLGFGRYSYTTQIADTKTSYNITTQHGPRPKYFTIANPDVKKVRDQDDDATYRKVVNVEVICRDLWELKNDDVVIF